MCPVSYPWRARLPSACVPLMRLTPACLVSVCLSKKLYIFNWLSVLWQQGIFLCVCVSFIFSQQVSSIGWAVQFQYSPDCDKTTSLSHEGSWAEDKIEAPHAEAFKSAKDLLCVLQDSLLSNYAVNFAVTLHKTSTWYVWIESHCVYISAQLL